MNKQAQEQLDRLIAEVEKFKSIINAQKTKEERFFELIQGLTPKWDKERFPDCILYYKGDEFMFVYYQETGYAHISYHSFWEVFEKDYSLNYQEIRDFLKGMLEEHFKWKGLTPGSSMMLVPSALE